MNQWNEITQIYDSVKLWMPFLTLNAQHYYIILISHIHIIVTYDGIKFGGGGS